MNRMKELINELNEASSLYYNGKESFLTDKEFDLKLKELKELEQKEKVIYSNSPTINVGAPVLDGIKTVSIPSKPMLSLDKAHTTKEVIDFSNGYDIIGSVKCDGLSVRLIYKDTDLVSANTRGNGFEGQDITEHAKHFLNVPIKIAKTGTYIIDGEAVILADDLAIVNSTRTGDDIFKVARNAASGAFTLQDMREFTSRRVSFIAWDVIEGGSTNYYHYNMEEAQNLGFTIVPAFALDCTKVEDEEIDNINQDILKIAKESGIPCDGVVWRINDIIAGDKLGKTAHHFLNAIAWKPDDEEYPSELLDIEWSMSRTGTLTPVAICKPTEIDGTIIERCSLHNLSVLRETLGNEPEKNQPIWIVKRNSIIPQISRAIKNDIPHDHILGNYPMFCPVCSEPTKIEESDAGVLNVVCTNPYCCGKLINRIDHYLGIKGLNVKGISKATIEKLITWGWLRHIVDIYLLDMYRDLWINKPGFGVASVDKILNAIEGSKHNVILADYISALGIPLVGKTVAKEITKYYDTWKDFRDAVGGDWTEFEGFGPEISRSINNFDFQEADTIAEQLEFAEARSEENKAAAAIKDKKFCVTGKLQHFTRSSIKEDIESHGGKMVSSVSSVTDYLITNTPDSNTQKNKDAQRLGVKLLTEDEYLKLRD